MNRTWFSPKRMNLAQTPWPMVRGYPGTAAVWVLCQAAFILWETAKFLLLVTYYVARLLGQLAVAFPAGAAVGLLIEVHKDT